MMRVFTFLLIFFIGFGANAQKPGLDTLTKAYQTWRNTALGEKVFVHTDRSSYLTGETIWLKVYRAEASSHRAIDWSKILYVELLDKNKLSVLQTKFSLDKNGCEGAIFLPASLSSGNYVLRAYTNWMKNAGPEFFFHQAITILNPFVALEASADTIQASSRYDVQFFPEGGDLVYGLESVVGVRVADRNGFGTFYKGAVLNDKKDTVVRFNSSRAGLSKFSIKPERDQSYTVVIVDKKKRAANYSLPAPKIDGYVMHVKDSTDKLIAITLEATGTYDETVYLLGHTRQALKVQQHALLHNGMAKFIVAKNILEPGVSSLTIFNTNLQPVGERLYFNKPDKKLAINLNGNPYLTKTREKVKLDVILGELTDSLPNPAFSLAVYKVDSLDLPVQNIVHYLWLTSDLSGTVEDPAYYFSEETPELQKNTDILMLTHGWRRFDWSNIKKKSSSYPFLPEIGGHLVFGKITELATGKPAERVAVYLSFMGMPVNVYVSESAQGRLLFETEPILGNKSMIVQTAFNSTGQYRIEMEDPYVEKVSFSCPPFSINHKQGYALQQRSIHMQVQNLFNSNDEPDKLSNPVKAFYGKPDETYQLDDYTRFPTLEEVMREYVPGIRVRKQKDEFYLSNIDLVNKAVFSNNPLVLVDGVPVFDMNKLMAINPLKLKQLDVVKRRYYLNAMSYEGIVSYTSYKGDLGGFQPPEHALLMNYKGLETKREFFTPRYDQGKTNAQTLPDTRRVLYWTAGNLPGSGNHRMAEFFTSDIAGEYKIVIQALTSDGLPGYFSTTFLVK